jgi:hypothetical protein
MKYPEMHDGKSRKYPYFRHSISGTEIRGSKFEFSTNCSLFPPYFRKSGKCAKECINFDESSFAFPCASVVSTFRRISAMYFRHCQLASVSLISAHFWATKKYIFPTPFPPHALPINPRLIDPHGWF